MARCRTLEDDASRTFTNVSPVTRVRRPPTLDSSDLLAVLSVRAPLRRTIGSAALAQDGVSGRSQTNRVRVGFGLQSSSLPHALFKAAVRAAVAADARHPAKFCRWIQVLSDISEIVCSIVVPDARLVGSSLPRAEESSRFWKGGVAREVGRKDKGLLLFCPLRISGQSKPSSRCTQSSIGSHHPPLCPDLTLVYGT